MLFSLLISATMAGATPKIDPCNGSTTPDVDACLAASLNRSNARLNEYLEAALKRNDDDAKAAVRLGIGSAQNAFEAYRAKECDTVYEDWKDGTIRGAMSLSCRVRLTDSRTHDVWESWLRYMDSTPPILPEPKPTR